MTQSFGITVTNQTVSSLLAAEAWMPPKAVTLLSSGTAQELVRGTVLGQVLRAVGTAAYTRAGTSNGVIGSITMGKKTKVGNYVLTCIAASNVPAAAAASAALTGNIGNGAVTAAPAASAAAKVGRHLFICKSEAAGLGTFIHLDPDGVYIGLATVATEYVGGGLTLTIADGSEDWDVGDAFTVTVAAAGTGGAFRVIDPEGCRLPDAAIGTAYTNAQINFTIADGTTDWDVGDVITVPITVGSEKYAGMNPDAVDGTEVSAAILAEDIDVPASGDEKANVYLCGYFLKADFAWTHSGITTAEKNQAYRELASAGIFAR